MPVSQPKWINHLAPNLSKRRLKPTLIVLHHTGGHLAGDLATLTNPGGRRVSADFLVAKDGTIYKLNPQLSQFYTWQAGVSSWKGRGNCNPYSIGIEQEHMPGEAWPAAQIQATAHLCAWLQSQFGITDIESHAAVALPKGRKTDPENYPWAEFSASVKSFTAQG